MRLFAKRSGLLALLILLSVPSYCLSQQPKSGRNVADVARAIDREIQKQLDAANIKASAQADDAEFLRRVTLDITGTIPTTDLAAKFLRNTDADKREKLIDQLLADSRYGVYHAGVWGDRIDATGTPPRSMASRFREWLAGEFNRGNSWNKIVQDMLTDGNGPAGYFVWANYKEPGELADTTSRFFLGVRIACARCHNHPLADWTQSDYWGMAAFYTRIKRVRLKGKGNILTEDPIPGKKKRKPETKGATITIPSAGTRNGAGKIIRARFLSGDIPELPDEGALRPTLANWIVAKRNPYFAKATVNRIWAHFFGKGLVRLADGFDSGTEPSHPELLKLLATEFTESGYDLKHLIRCICRSQTYQRSSRPLPDNKKDETLYSHMPVRVLAPGVLFDSVVTAMGNPRLRGGLASPLPYEIYSGKKRSTNVSTRQAFIEFFGEKDESVKATQYTYGIPQVLALMNAKQFNETSPLVEKMVKDKVSRDQAIDTLFLATLTRMPNDNEHRLMTNYLEGRTNLEAGYSGVLWILLNTNEFTVNH